MESNKKKIDGRVIELNEDFARRAEERKELERAWLINVNYYRGNQYAEVMPTGAIASVSKRYPWQLTSVYNHIAPMIEARMAKFNRLSTGITCLPASSAISDEAAAKFATKLLKSVGENADLRSAVREGTFWAEVCGTAFYKIVWDKTKGRKLTASGLREGDATVTVCPPQEIYPDSLNARNVADCRSIIHAKAYPVEVIEDCWEVKIDKEALSAGVMSEFDRTKGVGFKQKDGYVLLIERYSLPTSDFPEGRLLIVAADKVLYDGALPYETEVGGGKGLPFVRQINIPEHNSFFGGSLVERMIPVQRAYNDVKNRKHEFFNRMTAGVMLVEDGSVDVDELDEDGIAPGKVIIYRQGCEKPQVVDFGEVPKEFGEEEDRLLKEFVTIGGVSDLLLTGMCVGSDYSGTALSVINEQSNARLCVTTENIRAAEKEIAVKLLRLYKQFATAERLSVTENGAFGEKEAFVRCEISSDDVVFDVDDGQTSSIIERRNLAKEIYSMNLLTDEHGKMEADGKRKLLELLGCEGFSPSKGGEELHRAKAERENVELEEKEVEAEEYDDHAIHIQRHTNYLVSGEKICEKGKENFAKHIAEHRAMDEKGNKEIKA